MTWEAQAKHRAAFYERADALTRTIDWLVAHPAGAIIGKLATDDTGASVLPHDPDASCFCFLGRLCVEADIPADWNEDGLNINSGPLWEWMTTFGDPAAIFSTLVQANDLHTNHGQRMVELRHAADEITAKGGHYAQRYDY